MIELKTITAGYGKTDVLKGISASFEKGMLTALIGVNGSGKSTLLKTMTLIQPIRSGEITLDGRSLSEMTRNEIARKLSYLSQGRTSADMTVEQLVLHGRFPHLHYPRRYGRKDLEIARAAMDKLGISPLAKQPLRELSGGMRQNACIAMALAQDTDYILLDEPTTYLDISHQLELMKVLRALADSGKGIVAVMHDLPMAFTFADRIVLIHEGSVRRSGTPEQVCSDDLIRRILGVTLEKEADTQSYRYRLFRE